VSRQPFREVDVEVVATVVGVSGGDAGQRAAPGVGDDDDDLDQHDPGQHGGGGEPILQREDRDRDDAPGEERPDDRVSELDGAKDAGPMPVGLSHDGRASLGGRESTAREDSHRQQTHQASGPRAPAAPALGEMPSARRSERSNEHVRGLGHVLTTHRERWPEGHRDRAERKRQELPVPGVLATLEK